MNVEVKPELASRLSEAAKQQALSVGELVERVLARYLDARMEDAALWVQVTQQGLPKVWSPEDFSSWLAGFIMQG